MAVLPQEGKRSLRGPLALLGLAAVLYLLGAAIGPMAGVIDGLFLEQVGGLFKGAGLLAGFLGVLWWTHKPKS